jgi:uncharacterized damage-inducible protein DinB
MPAAKESKQFDLAQSLLTAFATNDRINHYLIRNLPEAAWRAKTPDGKGRTIAAIFGHMHNVRLMWLKAVGATDIPAKLEGEAFTTSDAIAALESSRTAIAALLEPALRGDGRIKGFKPDAGSFLGYLFAHDAHHRGQASMLARMTGNKLPQSAMFGMWEWGTR